jgi:hypothetical protein
MMATMFSAPVREVYNFLPDWGNFCFGQGSKYAVNASVDFQALLDFSKPPLMPCVPYDTNLFEVPKDVEAGHPTTPTIL